MGIIVGYENEKKELAQLKGMLLNSGSYKECGIRIPRGVVLFGHPGVGKTQLAKTVFDEKICVVELRAATCCEDDAQQALQAVFEKARCNQPAVILLDELDKIAGTSEQFFMEGNNNIQKALLQELDTLKEADAVLVVATCNDTEVLGDALLRPGRFDRQLYVEEPDEETRERILEAYFSKIRLKKSLDYGYIAQITPGYTGAQLECLANEVGIEAMKDERKAIDIEDVRRVMNKLAFNGSEKEPIKDEEKKRSVAVHEAGHAVVALALEPKSIVGASILPQGQSNGHVFTVGNPEGNVSVGTMEKQIVVALGGHVAERLVLGEYLVGSGDDLQMACARLRFLTFHEGAYGYEGVLDSVSTRPGFIQQIGRDASNTAYTVMIEKMNTFDALAEKIIKNNRALFDELADALVTRQTLSRDEIFSIAEKHTIICEAA